MLTVTFKDWAEAALVASTLDKQSDHFRSIGANSSAAELEEVSQRIRAAISQQNQMNWPPMAPGAQA